MRTWLNKDGLYVSDKPKEYFVGKDAHGNNVFIGDTLQFKDSKICFKVADEQYFGTSYYISKCTLKKRD